MNRPFRESLENKQALARLIHDRWSNILVACQACTVDHPHPGPCQACGQV